MQLVGDWRQCQAVGAGERGDHDLIGVIGSEPAIFGDHAGAPLPFIDIDRLDRHPADAARRVDLFDDEFGGITSGHSVGRRRA